METLPPSEVPLRPEDRTPAHTVGVSCSSPGTGPWAAFPWEEMGDLWGMLRVNAVLPWLSLCQVWLKTARTRALPCEK